jgi:hypothetical protein
MCKHCIDAILEYFGGLLVVAGLTVALVYLTGWTDIELVLDLGRTLGALGKGWLIAYALWRAAVAGGDARGSADWRHL